jgi:hypothetical protein
VSRYVVPIDALQNVTVSPKMDLTECEFAILQATQARALSTIAIAEQLGLGYNPSLVVPILQRLESLNLLDGYYAAGRSTGSLNETHRRYYRSSERGRLVTASQV